MSETETHAFCLKMVDGMADEYERRHDEIWPEMKQMLLDSGIIEYEIYVEKETNLLFGHIIRKKNHAMASTPGNPVNQRWTCWSRRTAPTSAAS
jgi:L-rhamnose mutarotase